MSAFNNTGAPDDVACLLELFLTNDNLLLKEKHFQTLHAFCSLIYSSTRIKELLLSETNFFESLLGNEKIISALIEARGHPEAGIAMKIDFYLMLFLPLLTNLQLQGVQQFKSEEQLQDSQQFRSYVLLERFLKHPQIQQLLSLENVVQIVYTLMKF